MRIFLSILFLMLTIKSQAVMTLLNRELFTNGDVTITATNSFNTVLGTLHARRVGPRYTNDSSVGWSADCELAYPSAGSASIYGYYNLLIGSQANAKTWGCALAFLRITRYPVSDGVLTHFPQIIGAYKTNTAGSRSFSLGINTNGYIEYNEANATTVTNGLMPLSLNVWYAIKLEWNYASTFNYNVSWMTNTGSWVLDRSNNFTASGNTISNVLFGDFNDSSEPWMGRIGGCCLEQIGAFGEGAIPADMVFPPEIQSTWYVNTSTGSDTNDGYTASTPWLSSGKLGTELYYSGVLGTATPWVYISNSNSIGALSHVAWSQGITNNTIRINGDIVFIDTSGGVPLYLTNSLVFGPNQDGIELTGSSTNYADIRGMNKLTTFSQYNAGTFPNVWQSAAFTNSVLWEDKRWFSTLSEASLNPALAAAAINATPGTCFCDNTNVYFSTFEGGNPNSDGHLYEASRFLADIVGNGPQQDIFFNGGDYFVQYISAGGSCLASPTSLALSINYPLQLQQIGNAVLKNSYFYYGSTHDVGQTGGNTNMADVWLGVTAAGQCAPFASLANYGAMVEFSSNTNSCHNYALFDGCSVPACQGVVGSTNGIISTLANFGVSVDTHNSGGTNTQYDSMDFVGDLFTGGETALGGVMTISAYVDDCNLFLPQITSNSVTINSSTIGTGIFTKNAFLNVNNSIIRNDVLQLGNSSILQSGTNTYKGCTFYGATAATVLNDYGEGLISSGGNLTLNLTNNIFISKSSPYMPVIFRLFSTNTVNSDHNVFLLDVANLAKLSYQNDSPITTNTFAQWVALGHDSNSVAADPQLNAYLKPFSTSPARSVGLDIGNSYDFTGDFFGDRRTAGAYEFRALTGFLLGL